MADMFGWQEGWYGVTYVQSELWKYLTKNKTKEQAGAGLRQARFNFDGPLQSEVSHFQQHLWASYWDNCSQIDQASKREEETEIDRKREREREWFIQIIL